MPYLVLYRLVVVNCGEFASADDAETFGACALGLSKGEYYKALCETADRLGGWKLGECKHNVWETARDAAVPREGGGITIPEGRRANRWSAFGKIGSAARRDCWKIDPRWNGSLPLQHGAKRRRSASPERCPKRGRGGASGVNEGVLRRV